MYLSVDFEQYYIHVALTLLHYEFGVSFFVIENIFIVH